MSELLALAAKRFRYRLQSEQEQNAEAALSNLPFGYVAGPWFHHSGLADCQKWSICICIECECIASPKELRRCRPRKGRRPNGKRNPLVVNSELAGVHPELTKQPNWRLTCRLKSKSSNHAKTRPSSGHRLGIFSKG